MNNSNYNYPSPTPREFAKAQAAMQASNLQSSNLGAMQECASTEQPRDREIPAKIARLYHATDELSEKLAAFGERLHGVLVPRPSAPGNCTTSATAPSATAMGEQLAQLNARLTLMIEAVDSLDATLEL
jgi:hypothetical protein